MKLFTSNFAFSGNHPNAISIAKSNPKWYKGKSFCDDSLSPSWELLKMYKNGYVTKYEYTEVFYNYLTEMNVQRILDILHHDMGDMAILLCYENPGEFCHRRIVAKWIEYESGIVVPELKNVLK